MIDTKETGWIEGCGTRKYPVYCKVGTIINAYLTDNRDGTFYMEITRYDCNQYSNNGRLRGGNIQAQSPEEAFIVAEQKIAEAGYHFNAKRDKI